MSSIGSTAGTNQFGLGLILQPRTDKEAHTQDVTATQGHQTTSLFSISISQPIINPHHTSRDQNFFMRESEQKNAHHSSCNLFYHALVTTLTEGRETSLQQYLPMQIHPFPLENIVQTLCLMLLTKVFMIQQSTVQTQTGSPSDPGDINFEKPGMFTCQRRKTPASL